jgi:CheY-like chemotaxis protein
VLANLLENAIRHGGDTIRVRAPVRRTGWSRSASRTTARACPKAALPHLFEKFYQAGPPGEGKRRGMGIGMTVVEGLTGRCAARSRLAAASSAACAWTCGCAPLVPRPRRRPAEGDAEIAGTGAMGGTGALMSGPALLIVEDEAPARHALAEYLEHRGYEVYEAATAHEAMRQWDAHRADLVLLDLGLPDLDGVDVIRRIRREATTPIIILSARGDERDKIAAWRRARTTT